MRRHTITFTLLFLLAVETSCLSGESTGTLRIQLYNPVNKTITNDPNVYVPTKYIINGTGPGNSTINIESTSSLIIREGVRLGSWTFAATSYNSDGRAIATGNASFTLDSSSLTRNIILSSTDGNGSAKISFEWDSTVTEPHIDIVVKSVKTSEETARTINPSASVTNTVFTIADLPAGSYIMKATLRNGTTSIATTVEAINIANSIRTSGSISFTSDISNDSESEDMTIYDSSGTKIKGTLSYPSSSIASGTKTTVLLGLESSNVTDLSGYMISWYLDGKQIKDECNLDSSGNYVSFIPQSGNHILNAVVVNRENGSAESAKWQFVSQSTGKEGVAIYEETIETGTDGSVHILADMFSLSSPIFDFA